MNILEIFEFLNDFKLTQTYTIKRTHIKQLISYINLSSDQDFKHANLLTLTGFIELLLQLGYHINNHESDKPSVFMPLLFKYLKGISFASDKPLFQKLFHNPQVSEIGNQ